MLVSTGTVEVLAHLWKRAARPDLENVSDPAGLAKAKRLMRLAWSDARLQVSFGDIAVIAQLIQGSFPNYRQLIPSSFTATATIMAEDMERALRQLALAARDGSGIVRLIWEGEQLLISAKSEKFETSLPVPATCSAPGKVAVSLKYLMEYCRGRIGKITLSWSSPSSPILFSQRDHPHVVVMPMYVKWDGDQPEPEEKPTEAASSEVAPESNPEEAADTDVTAESQGEDETPQRSRNGRSGYSSTA